tara:strand:- start:174 stop:770 length:597 start_codon:yes stop_codon:yes gene_type:complete
VNNNDFSKSAHSYLRLLANSFSEKIVNKIETLTDDLQKVWEKGNKVFICGNGGSAANAIHISNDFIYGIGQCGDFNRKAGIRIEALTANSSIITCLANDIGYENIFSYQLQVKAEKDDLLIVLSGSGNSKNIVNALTQAKELGLKTYAILGFTGGKCLQLADIPIHFPINDMQIAEDTQLLVGHICMQWLSKQRNQVH